MDLFFILEEKIIFECILKLLSLKQDKLLTLDLEVLDKNKEFLSNKY